MTPYEWSMIILTVLRFMYDCYKNKKKKTGA